MRFYGRVYRGHSGISNIKCYRRRIFMAKQEAKNAPEPKTEVELLQEKIAAMREAQKVFATFTEEQVDKIFFEAAMAANKQRIPLAKLACEETGMGVWKTRSSRIIMLLSICIMLIRRLRPLV